MIDGRGLRTQYAYDAKGQMTSKTEAVGTPIARTTFWQYANSSYPAFPTRIETPSTSGGAALRVTVLSYNAAGDLQTRTIQGAEAGSSFSYTTESTFNAAGQPLGIDPPGYGTADQTTFSYDPARGNLLPLTRTDPLIGTTTFSYDGLNRRVSTIDPNGLETVTTYDSLHRVTSVTRKGETTGDDIVTANEYDAFGDLFRTTLPKGNVIEYGHDVAGRLVSIERKPDAATHGERTLYTLNALGHHIKEELQRWNGTTWATESFTDFVYTSRCHLDKVVNADGTATEYAYDCDGNLEKVWDANHPKTSNPNPTQLYAYDALNRMTSVTAGPGTANAAVTSYAYDVQDHLASVTDAEGNLTSYTTSDRDLMTLQLSPVSGTTSHTYNEHGEMLTTTDARAIVVTRTVDATDRVSQETFGPPGSPDPSLTITYAYGSTPAQFDAGRLTGITRDGQTITYNYDRFGRVLQDGALTYGYDKNGNRTTIAYPGGLSAIYTHDFADREATLSYDSGGGPQPLVTGAGYKALDPLSFLSFANGLSETRLFDQRYFPDRIQAGTLLDWDYTVDAVGNPTAISGSIIGTPYSTDFAYQDHLYFLTQGNGPWGDRAWTYDKIGNRLTFARTSEPTQTYTYSGAGHNPKLATITPAPGWGTGTWTYGYDPAGNQTSVIESNDEEAVQTTFYDVAADGRMSALRTATGPSRTDFLYDGRGFLRQALLTVSGSTDSIRVNPVYSTEGMLMARTEERQWTDATIGPDGEDQELAQMSTETTRVFYFAGRPVAQLATGPELLYLTTDHLGTPVLATDASAAPIWAGGVEPFGTTWAMGLDNPDPDFSTTGAWRFAAAPASSQPEEVFLRYSGQWASDAFRVTGNQGEVYYYHRLQLQYWGGGQKPRKGIRLALGSLLGKLSCRARVWWPRYRTTGRSGQRVPGYPQVRC